MNTLSFNSLFCKSSDRPICFLEDEPLALSSVQNRVASLSNKLSESTEHHWVLASDSTINFLCGFLALLASGKEILLPPNNLAGTINETLVGAEALLTDLDLETHLDKIELTDNRLNSQIEFPDKLCELDVNNLFIQICTSGSTGEPKQIRKSLATLEDEIQSLEHLWGDAVNDRVFISTVSHQHIYGLLFRLLWPLLSGRLFVDENVEYPEQIESLSKRFDGMVLVSSPAYLKRMADVLDKDCVRQNINVMFSSGGPLSLETSVLYAEQFGVTPTEVLGSTETGGIAYRQQQAGHDVLWQRFYEVEIRKQDKNGALAIRSPFCFTRDWFEMGDAVEIVDPSHFKLLGRIDRIVKLEEKRISLDRMESILAQNSLVEQVKVIVLEGYRTILGAVCVLTEAGREKLVQTGRREFSNQLREYLAAYFDRVSLPRKWRYIADFPYNTQGKITQADLVRLFDDNNGGAE